MRFRLFQYRDGYGNVVYRIKRRGLFGIWYWVTYNSSCEDEPRIFNSAEAAFTYMKAEFDKLILQERNRQHYEKLHDLKLIIEEEITHEKCLERLVQISEHEANVG